MEGNPRDAATPADLGKIATGEYLDKIIVNTGRIVREELPRLGGNWIAGLFLAARFRVPGAAAIAFRWHLD